MVVLNYIVLIVAILTLGILYQKFIEKQARHNTTFDDYGQIQKYLLKDKTLDESKNPILWIHLPHEYNARDWLDFGSRSSTNINQPYLYLTVQSIIKCCDQSFKIVIIDDGTFEKIIPGWTINMNIISDPIKCYMRQLAMAKLIYTYGGMNVPISFLCFKDLLDLYKKGTRNDCMFVCENYDMNITSVNKLFFPNAAFMGAPKENQTVKQFIHYLEQTISDDYTAQTLFLGDFDKWCENKIKHRRMNLIPGTDVGVRTVDDEPVTVETLLGDDYIHFYPKMFGIWIPDKMILKRRYYEWFARMDAKQILTSQFILAKYMLLALAPDSHMGVIEPLENNNHDTNWIGFWKVPINSDSHTLNVFGPMPQNLGNNVPKAKNTGNLP